MAYNTELAARSIVKMLYDYNKGLRPFDEKIRNKQQSGTGSDADRQKEIMRIEVEKEAYAAKCKEEVSAAAAAAVAEEETLAEARRVAEERRTATIFRTPAHQSEISNALKMIEMLSERMTTEQMQSIVNPFVADMDYGTLRLLESIAKVHCQHLFLPYARPINFGDVPGKALEFMRGVAVLIGKAFDADTLRSATAAAFIERKVNEFFEEEKPATGV